MAKFCVVQPKSKRLIAILSAIALVLVGAIVASIALASARQKSDTAEKIHVTTYDHLPLLIDDSGVVTTYVGAKDGTAVVDIPASYSISGQGLPIAGNDYKITKIADEAFKDINFAFAKIDMANVTNVGTSAFENAKNIYLYGSEDGYLIGDYAFRNATVAFDKIVLCADQGGTPSVGVSAFENSNSFDPTVTVATLASAKSDLDCVFAEDYTTNGTIEPTTASGIISITGTAFQGNGVATSVDFSSFTGILNLGDKAFYGATQLGPVSIGKGITSIGKSCFEKSNISAFAVATDGATSTPEWYRTFYNCTNLSSATLPNGATSLSAVYDVDYDDDIGPFGGCTKLSSVTLPSSLKTIGECAFQSCKSLTSINIPSSVTSIGHSAFEVCKSLSSINIPSSVTSIDDRAFMWCTSLTSINIPSSVTLIGEQVFNGCTSLTSINISSGVTSIGGNTFNYCTSLSSINIPASVTSIGEQVFNGCTSLSSINIPSGVTSIDEYTFYNCTSLSNINIPASVTSIGEKAFDGCTALTKTARGTTLTANTISLATNTNITDLNWLPGTIKTIGEESFWNWTNLGAATIPASVTSIGNYAFYRCTSLTSIDIPSSVTSIGEEAFSVCALTSINIPSIVASIGEGAFARNNLSSVFIPSSVSSIGKDCFNGNRNLKSIVFGATSASSGQIAFAKNTNLKTFPNISDIAIISDSFVDLDSDMPNVTDFCVPYAQTKMGMFNNDRQMAMQFLASNRLETIRFGQSRTWYSYKAEIPVNYPQGGALNYSETFTVSSDSIYTKGSDVFKALTYIYYQDSYPVGYVFYLLATEKSEDALDISY